ncbi:Uncharacterised protein [Serratia fonticola]|uniref:Uncharacterized protein n=1 Tax=Serratia fonticola TaxID=47917 RepID=A0A4V6KLH4_SERFO|nr:Uncharacterised protein [Serratia fonticola]
MRVVVDKRRNQGKASQAAINYAATHGIQIRIDGQLSYSARQDDDCRWQDVETGSFNYAPSAETQNSENVVVLRHMSDRYQASSSHTAKPLGFGPALQSEA